MTTKTKFDVIIKRKIPRLKNTFALLTFLLFALVYLLSLIFSYINKRTEIKILSAFHSQFNSNQILLFLLSLTFISLLIYIFSKTKKSGTIEFKNKSVELFVGDEYIIVPFVDIKNAYCNDPEKSYFFSSKFTLTIESKNESKILISVINPDDLKLFVEYILEQKDLNVEYSELTSVD